MVSIARLSEAPIADQPVDRETLAFLRVASARSGCAARSDLFEACAALSGNPVRAADALALALFRGMSGISRLRLYQPAATEISFDERWLLSALASARRGDSDSLTFLLTRRVPRSARRNIGFLMQSLARSMFEADGRCTD